MMPAPPLPPLPTPEPLHKVQYVIEIAGPRSMPASQAKAVLEPTWQSALGHPSCFVMGPSDTRWRSLEADDSTASYDSLALAWDLVGPMGDLHAASAQRLLDAVEPLATSLQRRAMPLPVPDEIDARVASLKEILAALDIGIEVMLVFPNGGTTDRELAEWAGEMDLKPTDDGFAWNVEGWDEPLLTLNRALDEPPFNPDASFLRQTASIGFNLPRCPAPLAVLDALITLSADAEATFQAACVIDEAMARPSMLRDFLPQAIAAFDSVGIRPGSGEARRIFAG